MKKIDVIIIKVVVLMLLVSYLIGLYINAETTCLILGIIVGSCYILYLLSHMFLLFPMVNIYYGVLNNTESIRTKIRKKSMILHIVFVIISVFISLLFVHFLWTYVYISLYTYNYTINNYINFFIDK